MYMKKDDHQDDHQALKDVLSMVWITYIAIFFPASVFKYFYIHNLFIPQYMITDLPFLPAHQALPDVKALEEVVINTQLVNPLSSLPTWLASQQV